MLNKVTDVKNNHLYVLPYQQTNKYCLIASRVCPSVGLSRARYLLLSVIVGSVEARIRAYSLSEV